MDQLQRTLFTGELVDLIVKCMSKHSQLTDNLHPLCLFTTRPNRFYLVPGSHEHAYYSILLFMLDYSSKFGKLMLQIGNAQQTVTTEYKCQLLIDGEIQMTILNHTKILTHLQMFPQQSLGSLNVCIIGYSVM